MILKDFRESDISRKYNPDCEYRLRELDWWLKTED